MTTSSSLSIVATATITCTALLLLASSARAAETQAEGPKRLPARAGEFALKIEPGVAFPLSRPQSQLFKAGGGETIKALWSLAPYVDIGPSVTFVDLANEDSVREDGTAWAFGGGVRLKRPYNAPDNDEFYGISPWVDADALYLRTGELDRPGFAAAVGLSVPLGEARAFRIGPFVRYLQILQGTSTGSDNRDARVLSLGISFEAGASVRREHHIVVAPEIRTTNTETFFCPDRDKDGVPDNVDHCPDVVGPMDNWGCPAYKKVIVHRDKLELKEKLYFAWDQAALQEESFPVLDEVVQALKDNKGFRVQVEGHSSSEGNDDHNQTLSENRANAVLDYLVAHGVGTERLVSKGFSSTVPIDTNKTIAGRENNRRVEFVVQFKILDSGSK
jgi:outer membrane protein OmpA-like peptidoglycan-associated protein